MSLLTGHLNGRRGRATEKYQKHTTNNGNKTKISDILFFFFSSKQVTVSFFFFLSIQFSGCWYSRKVTWLSRCLILEHFHQYLRPLPKENTVLISSCSLSPLPQALETTYLLSPDLPIPDITYKWNHKICSLLCLTSFTWHVIHTVAWNSNLFLFTAEYFCFMYISHFFLFIHSSFNGHWNCFQLYGYYELCCHEHLCRSFCVDIMF